jgi:hypothetical protein
MSLAKFGAVFYALWGLLHLVGGAAILLALGDGTAAGFAVYQNATGEFPAVSGAILAMNSFTIAWVGALVLFVAVTQNWRNRVAGAWLNFTLAGMMDVALVVFLLAPGFVSLGDAMLGISLLGVAAPCCFLAIHRPTPAAAATAIV